MSFRQFVNRLFPYLKSHIGKLAITSILMVFATALETAIPEITGQIIDTLFGSDRSNETARFYSILLFGTITISALSTLIALSSGSWISNKVILDLRIDMFSKLVTLPKTYFDKNTTGQTLSKLTFAKSLSIWIYGLFLLITTISIQLLFSEVSSETIKRLNLIILSYGLYYYIISSLTTFFSAKFKNSTSALSSILAICTLLYFSPSL